MEGMIICQNLNIKLIALEDRVFWTELFILAKLLFYFLAIFITSTLIVMNTTTVSRIIQLQ